MVSPIHNNANQGWFMMKKSMGAIGRIFFWKNATQKVEILLSYEFF